MQMLYVKLANFTGIPAISVPSGYDNNGLPTGIMLHGKWYDEEKLIKTSFHLEKLFERQKPQVFYNYWTSQINLNVHAENLCLDFYCKNFNLRQQGESKR